MRLIESIALSFAFFVAFGAQAAVCQDLKRVTVSISPPVLDDQGQILVYAEVFNGSDSRVCVSGNPVSGALVTFWSVDANLQFFEQPSEDFVGSEDNQRPQPKEYTTRAKRIRAGGQLAFDLTVPSLRQPYLVDAQHLWVRRYTEGEAIAIAVEILVFPCRFANVMRAIESSSVRVARSNLQKLSGLERYVVH